DQDADGIADASDNCPTNNNPGQHDRDGDQIGDVCDPCVARASGDVNGDGLVNSGDWAAFVSGLLDPAALAVGAACAAVVNADGQLNGLDVAAFVSRISGAG